MATKLRRCLKFISAMITFLHRKGDYKCIGHTGWSCTYSSDRDEAKESAMLRLATSRGILIWSLAIFLAQPGARAQEEKFGEVNFPISCSAAAQVQFNRAVAMLHSFFFPETGK